MQNNPLAFVAAIATVFLLPCLAARNTHADNARPNIVLIFIDDMGWGDLGCYGNDFIDTPRIDRMAKEGLRFTDFYASGAVCSPTRCALQSGQNQARIGITAHIPGHWRPFERVITPQTTMALPLDTVTVAESLQAAGYRTGYVGKWHLGRGDKFGPDKQGYEYAAEINGAHLPGMFRATNKSLPKPGADQFRTDYEAQLCEMFIREQKDKPFFLMLSPYQVHIPLASKSELVEKYRKRAEEQKRELPHPVYAAMVEEVDAQVGRVIDAIEAAGLTEKTMVIVTSDNGGLYRRYDYREHADDNVSSLAPLRNEKGSLYEGGIRIPMIVKYPGVTKPGSTTNTPAITHDLYPTFVAAAGGKLPDNQTIDGKDLLPLLTNPASKQHHTALYWHYPHYHHDRPASAIREGDWKLIEYLDGTGDVGLYHLAEDLGEANNLADQRKGKVADLKAKLNSWRVDVGARLPIANPSYDAERADEWWSRRSGKPLNSDGRKRFPQTEQDR
jgi:uncharacterized sulfatase